MHCCTCNNRIIVIDATSPHTLRSDTVDTHERSDTSCLSRNPFSRVRSHVLQTPMGGQSCPRDRPHMPSACPPARSQSHVMFHNSARADEATRSNPHVPVAVPRFNLLAPACLCSTSVNMTPLQRPVVPPPPDSHFERTCETRNSRTSHVATRFTLGAPRTFEGFLPLPQSTFESF